MSLEIKQALPLEFKIDMTKRRIREFVEYFGEKHIYISYSGGKDSEVLCHLAREMYPNIKMVFSNTGMEFPETVQQVLKRRAEGWNIDIVKPKDNFRDVWSSIGYPVVSKEQAQYIYTARNAKKQSTRDRRIYGDEQGRFKISKKWMHLLDADFPISDRCCSKLKKDPLKKYEKENDRHPIVATMAVESNLRKQSYEQKGCNVFDGRAMSKPMSFWVEEDVWEYIKRNEIEVSEAYTKHEYKRTGCYGCLFGIHLEKGENRIQRLGRTHPKLYNFLLEEMNYKHIMDTIGVEWRVVDEVPKECKL